MPVARIRPIRMLESYQPGSWHGTRDRDRSPNQNSCHSDVDVAACREDWGVKAT
jgi:hypothetical protein